MILSLNKDHPAAKIDEYNTYIAATRPLVDPLVINRQMWKDRVEKHALALGKELAKVPTHIAQEYCAIQPIHFIKRYKASLKNPELKRTVEFSGNKSTSWFTNNSKNEYWFTRMQAHPKLGHSHSIYKHSKGSELCLGYAPVCALYAEMGLRAITALCEQRTIHDRKQILDTLEPEVGSNAVCN